MSKSVFSELVELPKENHKFTAQQIKQKLLGGGIVGDLQRRRKTLDDAEADILEKKRDELQKELERQLKMDSQAKKSSKDMLKKHKRPPRRSTTSDSSSSSSDSSSSRKNSSSDDDSSSSSSSTSRDSRKKMLKRNAKRRRDTSSSSDDPPAKKKVPSRKHHQVKKVTVKGHTKKISTLKGHNSRAITPLSAGKRSASPLKSGLKTKKLLHHGLKERSRELKDRGDKLHVKDRVRSRSPGGKLRGKSRSPRRDSRELKRKSHEKRMSPAKVRLRRDRSADRKEPRRHEPALKERERRDKERADREAARNKERSEALARCQERQRERERLAKEKEMSEKPLVKHGDRLLPRPAERAMALAASRGESHEKSDRASYEGRRPGRYHESPTLRRDHVDRSREHEYMIVRNRPEGRVDARPQMTYDTSRRRDDHDVYSDAPPAEGRYDEDRHMEYQATRPQYGGAQMHREHDWERGMDQQPRERMYDRQDVQPNRQQNDWERNDAVNRAADSYAEGGEWKMNERQWDDAPKGQTNWQGGMKDESWEGGYEERNTWIDRHRDAPDGGRRWQGRRGGHQMMNSGENDGRNDTYRRPLHGHPHAPHLLQGDHMNTMNTTGVFHHNQGMRHIQQSHGSSTDMPPGNKEYGNQMPIQSHYNQGQSPIKRPRMVEEGGMMSTSLLDQTTSTLAENSLRKLAKTPNISDEVIEDNLSEISDDADDILNSVENTGEQKNTEKPDIVDDRKVSDGLKNTQEQVDENKDDEKGLKDMQDDFNLGFEEISDGELEEEARVKGLGDALGVDWTSLITESRARDQANRNVVTSVRQKWKHHEVLLNLGISTKMAGEEFTKDLLRRAREAAKEDAKHDGMAENDDGALHDIANVQVAQRKANVRRSHLISQAPGCFSRALNARRDLQIRRQLCGFPIQEVHYCSVNSELNNLAIQLFKKATSVVM
uniref:Putative rna-binding protein 25 n=1 Tax=Nyssomyia neivai TaxID=330878 RepID=A0A1L8DG10_9DIPT